MPATLQITVLLDIDMELIDLEKKKLCHLHCQMSQNTHKPKHASSLLYEFSVLTEITLRLYTQTEKMLQATLKKKQSVLFLIFYILSRTYLLFIKIKNAFCYFF